MEGQPTHEEIEAAKALLKKAGYFTDNLWCIDDVKGRCEDNNLPEPTDEECQEILRVTFANEATYAQIWESMDYAMEPEEEEDEDNE